MIQYTLKCDQSHKFQSWFQSSEAFERLQQAGHISCAICGSSKIEKSLMAPSVSTSRKKVVAPDQDTTPVLSEPQNEMEGALKKMRDYVEQNSDYVGQDFTKEARAMHEGNAPERSIYGEAKIEDAKALVDEGIPIAPLPFMPKRKAN
jgi:hypothetical protein